MKKILVDTDILMDYSKGYDRMLERLLNAQKDGRVELFLTPVNIAEYMTDAHLSDRKNHEIAKTLLDFFTVKEMGKAVGLLAGSYLREGKTEYLGDALIAAVAVDGAMTLVTRNRKHFRKIPGLSFWKRTP